MINSKRKFEKNMRNLLKRINNGTFDKSVLTDTDLECLYECSQRGYIRGIHLDRNAMGYLIGDVDHNIRLLYPGYAFMANRFPNWRSNLAIAISIIALAVSVLCEFTPIPEIIKKIFSGIVTLR